MKKIFVILFSSIILFSCTSSNLVSSTTIPIDKRTIYLSFDNTHSTVDAGGFIVGNMFISNIESASFNTLENRMLTKRILEEKGYKITQKLEMADMILFAGCESNEILSEVTILIVDSKTEEEYVITKGSFGIGLDLKGDMKGALQNALQSIPNR